MFRSLLPFILSSLSIEILIEFLNTKFAEPIEAVSVFCSLGAEPRAVIENNGVLCLTQANEIILYMAAAEIVSSVMAHGAS